MKFFDFSIFHRYVISHLSHIIGIQIFRSKRQRYAERTCSVSTWKIQESAVNLDSSIIVELVVKKTANSRQANPILPRASKARERWIDNEKYPCINWIFINRKKKKKNKIKASSHVAFSDYALRYKHFIQKHTYSTERLLLTYGVQSSLFGKHTFSLLQSQQLFIYTNE